MTRDDSSTDGDPPTADHDPERLDFGTWDAVQNGDYP
jgi:hypothetical protein